MVTIFVISSSKRIFVTFVTSKNHKQFVSGTWPGPLLLWQQVINNNNNNNNTTMFIQGTNKPYKGMTVGPVVS